jgi:hypothetical protein
MRSDAFASSVQKRGGKEMPLLQMALPVANLICNRLIDSFDSTNPPTLALTIWVNVSSATKGLATRNPTVSWATEGLATRNGEKWFRV